MRIYSHEKSKIWGAWKLPEEHMDVRKCAVISESLQTAKAAVETLEWKRSQKHSTFTKESIDNRQNNLKPLKCPVSMAVKQSCPSLWEPTSDTVCPDVGHGTSQSNLPCCFGLALSLSYFSCLHCAAIDFYKHSAFFCIFAMALSWVPLSLGQMAVRMLRDAGAFSSWVTLGDGVNAHCTVIQTWPSGARDGTQC